MSTSTTNANIANVANWQGVDGEPTAGSDNLVKSDGINKQINELANKNSYLFLLGVDFRDICVKGKYVAADGTIGSNANYGYIAKILCRGVIRFVASGRIKRFVFYNENDTIISYAENISSIAVPVNAAYVSITATITAKRTFTTILNPDGTFPIVVSLYEKREPISTSTGKQFKVTDQSRCEEINNDNTNVYTYRVFSGELISIASLFSGSGAFAFVDKDGSPLLYSSTYGEQVCVCPEGAIALKVTAPTDIKTPIMCVLSRHVKKWGNGLVVEYDKSYLHRGGQNVSGTNVKRRGSKFPTNDDGNTDAQWFSGEFKCSPKSRISIVTEGGTGTYRGYGFLNGGKIISQHSGGAVNVNNLVPPSGTTSIVVNCKETALDNFYLKIDDITTYANEIKALVDEIKYTSADLTVGNANNYPVGNTTAVGTVSGFNYMYFPCSKGQVITITTTGGNNTSRAIGFVDANDIIIAPNYPGSVSNLKVTVPENAARCVVNCKDEALSTFSCVVSPNNSYLSSILQKVLSLEETVEQSIPEVHSSIPMYHGKDMFFVKDTPLDFYAQEVLFKNFPAYKGCFVNNAPILATTASPDFTKPVINHVNPTGKVYFEDEDSVDIYADDGKLYKDNWNIVRGINVHTVDLDNKQKNIKVMCIGSSTTEIGLATYVKNYLSTLGVTMTGVGHKNDYLGTKSEGYYGWSNEQICGKIQNSNTYPQTGIPTGSTNPFMKLATAQDKIDYPDYCFTYVEGSKGTRVSYTDATDKTQDFYIFDFAWFLQTRSVETPDVVFFMLGINGTVENYGVYMPWIVDRIMQACPNCKIGINVCQAIRLETDADVEVQECCDKLDLMYNYVATKNSANLKVVSVHCYQSPYFSHDFTFSDGENEVTTEAVSKDGYLHMLNNGYLQLAKVIGAFICNCLPDTI